MSFFDALHANAARMGRPRRAPEIDVRSPPRAEPDFVRELGNGIEIQLKDLEDSAGFGGPLSYRGSQVLLYIREQGTRFDGIRDELLDGPRYHVASCSTLKRMRTQNRFERYIATNDVSGRFLLADSGGHRAREIRVRLDICRNCLAHLNYEGYRTDSSQRQAIFERFSLPTLFATYSTLFEFLPIGMGMRKSSDRRSWTPRASDAPETEVCRSCDVRLPSDSLLIGVPAGAPDDGSIVCADCRRKPPCSEPLHVSEEDMRRIARARRELSGGGTWEEAYRFADSAFHGLMKVHEQQGYEAPESGVELTDENGAVCVELGLAWPDSRYAVVLHEHEAELAIAQGWNALVLEAASINAREDG